MNSTDQRRGRGRALGIATSLLASTLLITPRAVSAEGLFDLFFNAFRQPHQAGLFADPFNQNPAPQQPRPIASGGPAFCVRSCDGKYFPLMRSNASPVQLCQAFCPASPTKVFFGTTIDSATSASGERYADSENAFAYRKALSADCTCNGRNAAGLAPVDLTLDTSLRAGDIIATTDGLVAYSGIKVGNNQSPEFTPVASYPGLTADVRARLGEMKVTPVSAESTSSETPPPSPDMAPAVTTVPKTNPAPKARRAELN